MKELFYEGDHFFLDLAPFLCYVKMAKEEWDDHRKRQSQILWPGI